MEQADEFRRLVARSFAAVGRDVDVHPDRVVDRSGTTIGLWNIGAMCLRADEAEWPQLIDEHVRLVATPARDFSDVTEAELGAGLSLRLVDARVGARSRRVSATHASSRQGSSRCSPSISGDAVATPSREELTATRHHRRAGRARAREPPGAPRQRYRAVGDGRKRRPRQVHGGQRRVALHGQPRPRAPGGHGAVQRGRRLGTRGPPRRSLPLRAALPADRRSRRPPSRCSTWSRLRSSASRTRSAH